MDNYGCIWNSFEAKDGWLDTVQYALHAGGHRFESCTAHHDYNRAVMVDIWGLPNERDNGTDNSPTRLPYYAWRVREIQMDIVIPSNRFQT